MTEAEHDVERPLITHLLELRDRVAELDNPRI